MSDRVGINEVNALTRGDDGFPPLIRACYNGHAATVLALLAAGASTDTTDTYGRTALTWASSEGHAEVVQTLLGAGASPNFKDYYGYPDT
jgi:ankyrin repeat protein